MKKYIIVSVYHYQTLENKVNEKMDEGYVPVGGPFTNHDNELSQAMLLNKVKKEKTNE